MTGNRYQEGNIIIKDIESEFIEVIQMQKNIKFEINSFTTEVRALKKNIMQFSCLKVCRITVQSLFKLLNVKRNDIFRAV